MYLFAMYDTYLLKDFILAVLNMLTHEGRLANCASTGINLTNTYASTTLLPYCYNILLHYLLWMVTFNMIRSVLHPSLIHRRGLHLLLH